MGGDAEPLDQSIIDILRSRDSVPTEVRLHSGDVYVVHDIAWGYDMGDRYAHVTSNVSPAVEGRPNDFFFTSDIEAIIEPVTGSVLFQSRDE